MPDLIDYFIFENVILYALNIPLFYALGSITFLALRGQGATFPYYIPSIVCLVIWLVMSQNPFGIGKVVTKCLVQAIWGKGDQRRVDLEEQS
jgi:hypothetical protein